MPAAPFRWVWLIVILVVVTAPVTGRAAAPPAMQPPDEATARTIREKTERLGREVDALRRQPVPDWKLVDVEVFHKAAVWVAAQGEWYKDYAKWTSQVLDHGLERAGQLKAGEAPWLARQGTVFRGYRSALDGSVQPYKIVLPRAYPGDAGKLWRLDLILHGRDDTITEVKFLHPGGSAEPPATAPVAAASAAPDQDYLELHVYGRGNNAYRWAGERDVFEALGAFRAAERAARGRETIDSNRIVLRGFSMGGAGAWHLGLHYPSFWCSVSPGAGFTTTYGREKNPGGKLPDYAVKCLGIYDAIDYAENVFDVPVVAYGGEIDPQLEASKAIQDKIEPLAPLGLHATFLVGPGMAHKYHPDSLKQIMRLQAEHAAAGRPAYPPRVRFVTMTPQYSDCFWVSVLRQDRQYERSLVDAERRDDGLHVKIENVRSLRLTVPEEWRNRPRVAIEIDGRPLQARLEPAAGEASLRSVVLLEKQDGNWSQVDPKQWHADADEGRWKVPGLTGPIDDAFTYPFLCVRGTSKPWHAPTQQYADAQLQRFSREWAKWFRGDLPVKTDVEVTAEDLERKNLVLFGDPSSNALIAKALPHLPLRWTADELTVAGKTYPAAGHIPALIYPSPFGQRRGARYVVLNSGHTFHDAEFKDTNRMLYPRLGDWAVLDVSPASTTSPSSPAPSAGRDAAPPQGVTAGLFDEQWHWPAEARR